MILTTYTVVSPTDLLHEIKRHSRQQNSQLEINNWTNQKTTYLQLRICKTFI